MKTCAACTHPQRARIDAALLDGRSRAQVARDFGLDAQVMGRHARKGHASLPTSTPGASAPLSAHPLHELAESLRLRALAGDAPAAREYRLALASLEASASAAAPSVDYTTTAEWTNIRTLLVRTIEPCPRCRVEVAQALRELDP